MIKSLSCAYCGRDFYSLNKRQVYCGANCRTRMCLYRAAYCRLSNGNKPNEGKMMDIRLELVETTEAEIMALAQFIKRVGWSDLRQNAVDDDEAYLMKNAVYKLQSAMAERGYAPR